MPDEVDAALDRDGGVIVKSMFSDVVDDLNAEMNETIFDYKNGIKGNAYMSEFAGRKTKRVTRLINRSAVFRERILDNEVLLSHMDRHMLQTTDAYWLSTAQIIELQPGEKAQLLHRDADNYPAFRQFGAAAPEVMMNCLVALSDYTEEMGATRAIPGSHKWQDWRRPVNQADTIPAVMNKGDAFLFSGKLIHGGGANVSERPRRALALVFCPGWLVPEEAYPFQIGRQLAGSLSHRARQLIGFRSFHNQKFEGGSLWQVDYEELDDFLSREENDELYNG
jgi:ectoine hydroxylase-related dioxygenase (phytanoyl-CoA dioxygenase family)